MPRGVAWCGTLNNPGGAETDHLKEMIKTEVWGIIGKEHMDGMSTTQTPHLQFAVVLRKRHTLQYMKSWNSRAHWEVMAGSPAQSKIYCSKEDPVPWQHGDCPDEVGAKKPTKAQGKRSDLDDFAQLIQDEGIQHAAMAMPAMYMKFPSGAEKIHSRLMKKARMTPREAPKVIWCYGPTGSGKTRWVKDQSAIVDQWWSGKNLKWWDGYDDESVVIIDDFRKDFCTFHELLRIFDRYEYRVEVKHGTTMLRASEIYVTSPFHPRDVYEGREDIQQLIRRISKILYFGSIIAEDVTCVIHYPGPKEKLTGSATTFLNPIDLTHLTAHQEEEEGINAGVPGWGGWE